MIDCQRLQSVCSGHRWKQMDVLDTYTYISHVIAVFPLGMTENCNHTE